MLRNIHLHGRLGKEFGSSHRFDVATAAEALRALNCAFPGRFVKALEQGAYKIVRGDKRNGMQLDLDLVNQFNLGLADLHLIPVAKGAASNTAKGTTKIVLGAALVGGAMFLSGGLLANSAGGIRHSERHDLRHRGSDRPWPRTVWCINAPDQARRSTNAGFQRPQCQRRQHRQFGSARKRGPADLWRVLGGHYSGRVWSEIEDISVSANSAGSIETAFGNG